MFALSTWRNRSLSATSQAGLVNNLNEGVARGLFSLFFAAAGLSVGRIGVVIAISAAVWGIGQLVTGAHPVWRALAVGVYRLWRDLGFAVGAVFSGILADAVDISGRARGDPSRVSGSRMTPWRADEPLRR